MADKSLNNLNDIWEFMGDHELTADQSEVDGVHILARVAGPAFFPDTVSGNMVKYSTNAWETALENPDFKKRLKDRLIFGTIGHDVVLDDKAVGAGLTSHIVTDMFIDQEGIGQAEYLILNTPTGRVLNTIIRAKSKMRVSTKCKGKFLPAKTGGITEVNPDLFFIDRIDFVINPGYNEALPSVMESQSELPLPSQQNSQENTSMENPDDKQRVIDMLTAQVDELRNQVASLTAQCQAAVEAKALAEASTAQAMEECKSLRESLDTQANEVATMSTQIADYDELGKPEEISEALKQAEVLITDLRGKVSANMKDIAESMKSTSVLAKYQELGTVEQISEALTKADAIADQLTAVHLKDIAESCKVPLTTVQKMHTAGMPMKDINEALAGIATATTTKLTRVSGQVSSKQLRNMADINESKAIPPATPSSTGLAARLMSRR